MSGTDEGWEELALPDMQRRVQNMLRPGEVSQVDYAKARIRVKHGDLESNWIPWATGRAGKNKFWSPPEIGEQVLLLSPGGDMSRAIALPGIYSDSNPANGDNGNLFRMTFENGTVIEYDREGNALKAVLKSGGTAVIEATGGITLKGDVTIEGNVDISKALNVQEDIQAMGEVTSFNAGAPINETTHIHPHPLGPTSSPTPGT
jgi:phage baseplate assembly protein V